MSDIKAMIRGAQLPERTVAVCLRADLVAEVEALDRELTEAQQTPRDSLASGGRARDLAERIEALREQMLDHTVELRLRAMPRRVWRAFVAEHPPRKDPESGEVDDRDTIGVNTETFWDELIRRSVVTPDLDDEDWSRLLGEILTDAQYNTLTDAAWGLNRREVDIPFSLAASKTLTSEPG